MRMRVPLRTLRTALLASGIMSFQILSAQKDSVSAAEAENLSNRLELSMNNGDPTLLNNLIYFHLQYLHSLSSNTLIFFILFLFQLDFFIFLKPL